MMRTIKITAKECTCDLCGYNWVSLAITKPESCRNRNCRSREWDGKSKPSYVNEIKFPSPRGQGRPKTRTFIEDHTEGDG